MEPCKLFSKFNTMLTLFLHSFSPFTNPSLRNEWPIVISILMRTYAAIVRVYKPLANGIWITPQFVGQELWCTGSMRSVEVESVIRYFSKILRCYSQRGSNHLHIANDVSAVGEHPDLFAVVFFGRRGTAWRSKGQLSASRR